MVTELQSRDGVEKGGKARQMLYGGMRGVGRMEHHPGNLCIRERCNGHLIPLKKQLSHDVEVLAAFVYPARHQQISQITTRRRFEYVCVARVIRETPLF